MTQTKPWIQVKPVIVHPLCYSLDKKQDCFNCKLHGKNSCLSPRGLCIKLYYNHKKGCPNYNKKKGCPPNVPMFDEVYDISHPVWAIYNAFDFGSHVQRMRDKHPQWSQRQVENCLYWQGTARKSLKQHIRDFYMVVVGQNYKVTTCPEAMGVNITQTMLNVGIELQWPPKTVTYQVALAGKFMKVGYK